ncbi:hypothetical protein BH09PSE6_BH09PSE6_00560 [soil metagenome]
MYAAGVSMLLAGAASAAPRTPVDDSEVVESLPSVGGWSLEQRRLRRELTARPRDARVAIEAAQAYLELARSQGDARYAGYAMGALQAWDGMPPAQTPAGILVMHATVAQFLHDFDGAETTLKQALEKQPSNAQAWITLATILRVRGRYADSDAACQSLAAVAPPLYAQACLAENAGLRGNTAGALKTFTALLADPALQATAQASTRQWLTTSVAEVEELAGRPAAAEAAYRRALALERSSYLLLAYSDFLLQQKRPAEVPALLDKEPRSDAVLLRLAIVESSRSSTTAAAAEMKARIEAEALRPGITAVHARESALFALDVQNDAKAALELARVNVRLQREPIDLLIFARAAAAARDEAARDEVRNLMKQIGLRDARVDALDEAKR